ncbi:TSUP family transporter [Microbacterium sp. W4I20]|uniref:sulfite exporter TauE/SafE family protein n=1 Tax=Microbacterium sp. W4I20 TaxID=3042262 RepID=UPI0027820431|nr:TSUP family transporter [Microbacterium sp. W4I20]MDQ0726402.1 putative membrane protein YfcA [Microbacterium sp. W4I20]
MDIGALLGLEQLTWGMLILIVVAAFSAGWMDAVVGGGGLLQLPALLLIPGMTPIQALATNKFASVFGTATSSVTYYRRAKPDIRTALPMAGIALAGSFGGAAVATILPPAAFKPIIVVALLAVALFTAFRPKMGAATQLRFQGRKHHIMAGAAGLAIGFYDGMIGPGTGTFLVISLVALLGYDFLQASAKAKIVNFATNLGALLLFIPHGSVLWLLGGILAVANIAGSYLGSRMAIARGTGFIRNVFLVVVIGLVGKLGFDVWNENIAPALALLG